MEIPCRKYCTILQRAALWNCEQHRPLDNAPGRNTILAETSPSTGRAIEVVTLAENDNEDLIADLVAMVYSFTARLYGQRRAKRKTERLAAELRGEGESDAAG